MENKLHFQRKVMLYIAKYEKKVKKDQKLEEECGRQRIVHTEIGGDWLPKRREF